MADSSNRRRVAIFVDGANLFKSSIEQGVRLNYSLLRQRLAGDRQLVSALYFGSYKPEPFERDKAFELTIREASFELRLRPLRVDVFGRRAPRGATVQITAAPGGNLRIFSEKGVDAALVTELLARAWDDAYDVAVLVSGDGDYVGAVRELRQHGKEVEVVFFPNASWELRESATLFVDLLKLLS